MGVYQKFLAFEVVVNITNQAEYASFIVRCRELYLTEIEHFAKNLYMFRDLLMSGGIQKYSTDEICFEYQLGKGFTYGSKQGYLDYEVEVISLADFLSATE